MPTISDVARACSVSTATVSYVLNDGTRPVSHLTRKKVLAAIKRLGYEPSAAARGLRRRRMDSVGVVFPRSDAPVIPNPYCAPILDGILAAATQARQDTTLFTGHAWSGPRDGLSAYANGRCDGLILISPPVGSDVVRDLKDRGLPCVVIGDAGGHAGVSRVDVDDAAAARELVGRLLELGHRRIAFLPGDGDSASTRRRLRGYRQALKERGVAFRKEWAPPGKYDEASGHARSLGLLTGPPEARPTAIFGGNDQIALGAVRAARDLGLQVPRDVSVAGFDDGPLALACNPSLTTVRQPLRTMGERAVELLLGQIEGRSQPGVVQVLPVELVTRGSTSPPGR